MMIMLFLGLPTYVCATASVPIAFVLYTKGFSLGAVLVFLMSGPATNITTIFYKIYSVWILVNVSDFKIKY